MRPSMAERNAASVLPEPVGAAISAWPPDLIAGQASFCAAVGSAKLALNQAATAGWNVGSDVTCRSCWLPRRGANAIAAGRLRTGQTGAHPAPLELRDCSGAESPPRG